MTRDIRFEVYRTSDVARSHWHLRVTHIPTGRVVEASGDNGTPGYLAARKRLVDELFIP